MKLTVLHEGNVGKAIGVGLLATALGTGAIAYRNHRRNAGDPQADAITATVPQQFQSWRDLAAFAKSRGFTVTSTTGGGHNDGSKHYLGLAIDVRTRDKSPQEVAALIKEAQGLGIVVKDERTRPVGQKVWSGPHIHLEISQ